jgi:hypothetical protein
VAGEEVIETGEALASFLEEQLPVGTKHTSLIGVKGTLAQGAEAWELDVRLVHWQLEGEERTVKDVREQRVPVCAALPVSAEALVAYFEAVERLIDAHPGSTLERSVPADFFVPEVVAAGGDFDEALRERFGPEAWLRGYHAEVKNGGHRQYFWNAGCRFWPEVLPQLGAAQMKVLAEAVALFGDAGPASDVAARRAQLAVFTPAQLHALTQLDERYLNHR